MTASNPVDQPFRRLFAGFDRDIDPPVDLATRLRVRVLAEAELDHPVILRPIPAPVQAADVPPALGDRLRSAPVAPIGERSLPPSSQPDEVGRRRRGQPWWLLVAEIAAGLLLLMGAAVVIVQRTVDTDRSAPRLGSSITAVASPSSEPQLLWERTDPDLLGTGDLAAGDDLIVRSVQDEHKSGFLWFEHYQYETFLQALDRRTGELRWQIPVDGYGTSYVTADAVLYVSYPNQESEPTSLIARSHEDGSQLWRTDLPAPPAFSPELSVRDNLVFLATYDATVRAYDLTTGAEVWATSVGEPPTPDATRYVSAHDLTLDGNRLLTLDPTGAVVELDAATGAVVVTHPAAITLPKTVYEGRLFVTADRLVTVITGADEEVDYKNGSQPEGVLRISVVDRATGERMWSTELAGDVAATARTDGGLLIWRYDGYDQNGTGTIQVLDIESGAEVWTAAQPSGFPLVSIDEAATSDGQLLIGSQSGDEATGRVLALDLATGAELWRYEVGGPVQMPPMVTGGIAIVGDAPDHLVAIAIPEHE